MTSKEALGTALENCEFLAYWEGGDYKDDFKRISEAFKEIEKNLEVLEILKRIPSIRLQIQEWSERHPVVTYAKERKIVKEWLK